MSRVSRPGSLRHAAESALLVCGPYYARNLREFGTPFQLSRDLPLVARVEGDHPPGARGWRDLFALSPRALLEPDPRAPQLLHSIWGTAYVGAWRWRRPAAFPTAWATASTPTGSAS